jgi:ABC-2 type transport system permease protein
VKALVDLYLQQFRTTFAMMVQYRAALVIWMIGHILEPLVYLVVWSAVSTANGGSVGEYSPREFAAYFLLLMLVNHVTYTWVMYEFETRIRDGSLSFALLRPVHPIHADIADNICAKLVTLPFMIVFAVILGALFDPHFAPPLWAIVAFIPALGFAFLVRGLLEWTLAQAAFWTTRVSAVNQAYFVLMLFLSGQIAPLSLFPSFVQTAADILPFRWMLGFPVELLLGHLSPAEAMTGLGAHIAWTGISIILLRLVWRAGVRSYSAVGA